MRTLMSSRMGALCCMGALVVAWAARLVPVRTSTVDELAAKVNALEAALAGAGGGLQSMQTFLADGTRHRIETHD